MQREHRWAEKERERQVLLAWFKWLIWGSSSGFSLASPSSVWLRGLFCVLAHVSGKLTDHMVYLAPPPPRSLLCMCNLGGGGLFDLENENYVVSLSQAGLQSLLLPYFLSRSLFPQGTYSSCPAWGPSRSFFTCLCFLAIHISFLATWLFQSFAHLPTVLFSLHFENSLCTLESSPLLDL